MKVAADGRQRLSFGFRNYHVIAILGLISATLFAGCTGLGRFQESMKAMGYPEKAFEGYRDYVWAQRAFNLRYGNCEIANSEDFQEGFYEGYCDMCEGGTGHTPPLPPQGYLSERYQSQTGKQSVESWFRGYPEGVRAAKQDGVAKFRSIYMSKEMKAALQLSQKTKSTISNEDIQKSNIMPSVAPSYAEPGSQIGPAAAPANTPSNFDVHSSVTPTPSSVPAGFVPPIVGASNLPLPSNVQPTTWHSK